LELNSNLLIILGVWVNNFFKCKLAQRPKLAHNITENLESTKKNNWGGEILKSEILGVIKNVK